MSEQERRAVVAGVDGSPEALRAVRWAAAEAVRRNAPLRLVTAFAWTRDRVVGQPGLGDRYRDILLERAQRHVATAEETARATAPDVQVEQQVVLGFPIPALAAEARQAQLVVVGDRGLTRLEGLLVGSVAVALAAHGPCPVVVVRGTEPDGDTAARPVVVGVDGTATSEAALEFAVDAATARGVPLVAVHAWSNLLVDPALPVPVDRRIVEHAQRRLLTQALAGWRAKQPDLPVEEVVVCDRPARALLREAQRAQLVVVGSRGHGELTGLVLGSTGNALVHRSPCPVAVVRTL